MKYYLLLLALAVAAPVFGAQLSLQHVSDDGHMSQPPSMHVFHENEDVEGAAMIQRDMELLLKMIKDLFLNASQPELLPTKHFRRSNLDLKNRIYPIDNCNHATNNDPVPRDCSEVVGNKSTVYSIKPSCAQEPFFVYCDLETQGGGWTVFQRRTNGKLNFYRNWKDYKYGFGNIEDEYWLGLEKIHALTKHKVYELYIELEDFESEKRYARYSSFAVDAETAGYPVNVLGKYEGDAGDAFVVQRGQKFSTFDIDNDDWKEGKCTDNHGGAWWYSHCTRSNLNGKYLKGEYSYETHQWQGMHWQYFRGFNYSLKASKMMVRPVSGTFLGL